MRSSVEFTKEFIDDQLQKFTDLAGPGSSFRWIQLVPELLINYVAALEEIKRLKGSPERIRVRVNCPECCRRVDVDMYPAGVVICPACENKVTVMSWERLDTPEECVFLLEKKNPNKWQNVKDGLPPRDDGADAFSVACDVILKDRSMFTSDHFEPFTIFFDFQKWYWLVNNLPRTDVVSWRKAE